MHGYAANCSCYASTVWKRKVFKEKKTERKTSNVSRRVSSFTANASTRVCILREEDTHNNDRGRINDNYVIIFQLSWRCIASAWASTVIDHE